jgi:hypothetical protein
MTTAARVAYAPCRPVWQLSPPANHPLRRKGGGIGSLVRGALSIITKSSPDNHVRIEADASELEPVDRPELVRATVGPVDAAVWLLQPPSNPVHTSRMWLRRRGVHLARRAARGGVIEDQRLEPRAGHKEDGVSLNQWMWITATVAQKIGRSKRRPTSSNARRGMLRAKT